jgi:hypothetical protein
LHGVQSTKPFLGPQQQAREAASVAMAGDQNRQQGYYYRNTLIQILLLRANVLVFRASRLACGLAGAYFLWRAQ